MKVIGLGDVVYWARIHEAVGIYEVCELTVRTVYPNCFVGIDKNSRQSHIISYDDCDVTVFDNRDLALAVVKEAEKRKTKEFTIDKSEEN